MQYLLLNIDGLPQITTVCGFSCQKGYSTGSRVASQDAFELTLVSSGRWEVSLLGQKYEVKPGYMKVYPPMVHRTALAVGEGTHTHNSIYMTLPTDYKILTQEQFEKQARICRTQHLFDTAGSRLFLPLVCNLSENTELIQRFNAIVDVQSSDSPYMKLRSSTLLMQMMISISEACLRKADMLGAHGGTSAFVVQKMIVYINNNYMRISRIEQIAEALNYNACYLSTAFRKYTGTNAVDYINHLRVEKAKALIEAGEKSFSEIAMEVGIKNTYYFYRIFKRYTKMTMGEYSRMFYR